MKKTDEKVEFYQIVNDILADDLFKSMKEMSHHGINRYDHSVSVAFWSFKIAKKLKMNYFSIARGALLHDFFESPEANSFGGRFRSIVQHPEIALNNSTTRFAINEMEKDIIKSHMFPFGTTFPEYGESWLVIGVDKTLAVYEVCSVAVFRMNYASTILKLFLLNLLR